MNKGWTSSDATTTSKTVTMNTHVGVPLTFQAEEVANTVRRLFDEQANAAAYALAKKMVDDLYALILPATFTNTTPQDVTNFGRPTVIDMSTALYAHQAVVAALYARVKGAPGRRINASLMEAAANLQSVRMMSAVRDGPFKSVDDLKHVKGIGAKRLEKLRADLTVGCDGRHSTVRARAGLTVEELDTPMDAFTA